MNWLHLGVPWLLCENNIQMYLGATDAPASLPHMYVKYDEKRYAIYTNVRIKYEDGDLARAARVAVISILYTSLLVLSLIYYYHSYGHCIIIDMVFVRARV